MEALDVVTELPPSDWDLPALDLMEDWPPTTPTRQAQRERLRRAALGDRQGCTAVTAHILEILGGASLPAKFLGAH
jgi:hypothetical protein